MPCPECGSEDIAWSYERGEVTCARCGLVVDRIYEPGDEAREARPHGYSARSYAGFVRRRERTYRAFEKLRRRAGRGGLFIEEGAFRAYLSSRSRRMVRVLSSPRNRMAEEALRSRGDLREIIEGIVMRDPLLASRTLRGRAAAAYIIRAVLRGNKPSPSEVSEATGVSLTQAKRLIALVRKRLGARERGWGDPPGFGGLRE